MKLVYLLLIGSGWGSNTTNDCIELYISQPVDQFAFTNRRFDQRYFACAGEFKAGGPMFFYTGNESPVDVYVNNTGLMWESARMFKALLIFAEHRYYGNSKVFQDCGHDSMRYLEAEQAMADYAHLITQSKLLWKFNHVIAFGGSYGGMLAAYMRMRYPELVNGAIAGSAPILSLVGLSPAPDHYAFNAIVAKTAGPACSSRVETAFEIFDHFSSSATGRARLSGLFHTCHRLSDKEAADGFRAYLADAWVTFAMGNYPYPSTYMTDMTATGDSAPLPAYPMQVACSKFDLVTPNDEASFLLALRDGVNVLVNVTGTASCLNKEVKPKPQCGNWDYQYCTEFMMPFSSRSESDFFFPPTEFSRAETAQKCSDKYNVTTQTSEPVVRYGGYAAVEATSNIVFSNGDLDPWTAFGVDCNRIACGHDVSSILIEGGAHHLDLMFANPADPESVVNARKNEVDAIHRWTDSTYENSYQVIVS